VVTSTDRRGAEVFAVDLGDALTDLGHRVSTVALAPGRTTPRLELPVLGLSPLGAETLRGLRRQARGVDVVVAHGSRTLPASAMALVGSTPFVYRNIGDPTQWSATTTRRVRTRVFLSRAAAVVALTSTAEAVLRDQYGVSPAKLAVIPTAVSPAHHRPADDEGRAAARAALGVPFDANVVATIGALSKEKNLALAIDAVASLPDVHLVVAGDGPERAQLESRATTAAPSRVHFTGALADPTPAFAACDLVVLTSRTEGLPAVLIEAGMRSLPVVTTDVGYVRDIVLDGVTGAVVPSGDRAALSAAIVSVRDDAARLGAQGRDHCERTFALPAIADRWSALLERVRPR
jgi:glycosyltransferase involved in cell wall biosynthesis